MNGTTDTNLVDDRLVDVLVLSATRQVETLLAYQILDILWRDSISLQKVEGGLDFSHIFKYNMAVKLHHILIFEKVLKELFEDVVQGLVVLGLLALLIPPLLLSSATPIVHWLPAHWAAVVTPLQAPALDAAFADVVTTDELGAGALFEAHWAIHSLT